MEYDGHSDRPSTLGIEFLGMGVDNYQMKLKQLSSNMDLMTLQAGSITTAMVRWM